MSAKLGGAFLSWRDPQGNFLFSVNRDGSLTFSDGTIQSSASPLSSSVKYADQFPGTTAAQQINAAIASLNGQRGTIDARNYGATQQVIDQTIALGSPTQSICLLVDRATTFLVTITNGTPAVQVFNASSIFGQGFYADGYPTGISLATTANVSAVIANGQTDGTQEFFWIENLFIQGHPSAICPTLVDIQSVFINSGIRNCVIDNPPAIGLHFRGASGGSVGGLGPFVVDNCWVNGENTPNARPVVIETQGTNPPGQITFVGCAIEHQGTGVGQKLVEIDGHGSLINGIKFVNTYFENHNMPGANLSSIGISIRDCDGCSIDNCTVGGLAGADFINISQSGANIDANISVINTRNYTFTNHINDTVNSYTNTDNYVSDWKFPKSGLSGLILGNLGLSNSTATTVGAAGGASALPATPLGYLVWKLGASSIKIPYYNL